jgi:hypothetical protein
MAPRLDWPMIGHISNVSKAVLEIAVPVLGGCVLVLGPAEVDACEICHDEPIGIDSVIWLDNLLTCCLVF